VVYSHNGEVLGGGLIRGERPSVAPTEAILAEASL